MTTLGGVAGPEPAECGAAGPAPVERAAGAPLVIGGVEDDTEPGADELLVVHDEHPDRRGRARGGHRAGSRAVTAKPPAGVGPTVRFPPQEATRSAMPARPSPDPASRGPGTAWPFSPSKRGPESVTLTVMYPGS